VIPFSSQISQRTDNFVNHIVDTTEYNMKLTVVDELKSDTLMPEQVSK